MMYTCGLPSRSLTKAISLPPGEAVSPDGIFRRRIAKPTAVDHAVSRCHVAR
jgi:hypothetical protein